MPDLEDAVQVHQLALSNLAQCRAAAGAWSDEQRLQLDRTRLDPIATDGERLLQALQKAAREIAAARSHLN